MSILLKNIGALAGVLDPGVTRLAGHEMDKVEILRQAWLLVGDGKIVDYGEEAAKPAPAIDDDCRVLDAGGGWVFPSFCDSHTHIVYAGSREAEFEYKIQGLSYEEIARRGGGILNSAARLRECPENELFRQAMERVAEVMWKGTGAIEIKSGYGLNVEAEMKMLRVVRRIAQESPLTVRATFLGAHAVPPEYRGDIDGYVDLICREMLPNIAKERLADYVDVFCDKGFFTVEHTRRILVEALKHGMKAKIHADELDLSGGTAVGVENGAVSVDHLERIGDNEIELLRNSSTVPTALPGASFFLGMPYSPAKKMIEAGLPVSLASDYNPGSSPSGDMKFINSLACIKMKLTPQQALNATTINGAAAMELGSTHGSVTRGKTANLFITEPLPSLAFLPYAYTTPIVKTVILKGEII